MAALVALLEHTLQPLEEVSGWVRSRTDTDDDRSTVLAAAVEAISRSRVCAISCIDPVELRAAILANLAALHLLCEWRRAYFAPRGKFPVAELDQEILALPYRDWR